MASFPNLFSPLFSFLSWRNSVKTLDVARSNAAAKLKITPVVAFPGPLDEMVSCRLSNASVESSFGRLKTFIGIEIVNESYSAQRILEAGFVDAEGARFPIEDWYWIDAPDRKPVDFDNSCQGFPIKLRTGEFGGIYLMISPFPEDFVFHKRAYVELDSGQVIFGVSKVVNEMANRISDCIKK